ncbi:MAG: DUF1289 domain-containing protein [Burkholderiaceae bacterium]
MMQPATLLRELGALALDAPQDLPSPCISVCRMNPASGLCEGCKRSLQEISAWSRMGDEGKRAVWRSILARLDDVQPRPAP